MHVVRDHERESGAPSETSGIRRLTASEEGVVASPRPSWPELVSLVRAQVRSFVGPSAELEDLTQNALEQVLHAIDGFEGRSELSTFTYRIASRVVMNHWRSLRRYLKRFVLAFEDAPEPEAGRAGDPMLFVERQRAARLHHHLERLPADQRMVIVLADLEDLPASRIALIVDCPEPTVRSRLRRGRADLARRLARDPLFADDVKGGVA
jgi:RNA polymerase sigma-70 factor, ECF subfamily